MRRRTRVISIAMVLSAGLLMSSSALPGLPTPPLWQTALEQPGATADPAVQAPPGTIAPVQRAQAGPPAGAIPAADAIKELKHSGTAVNLDSAGVVRSITAAPGKTLGSDADTFVTRYAAAFGLIKGHTVKATRQDGLPGGDLAKRFQQYANDLPVLGSEIVVTTTSGGDVRGAIAGAAALAAPAGRAGISPAEAQNRAINAAVKEFALTAAELKAAATLWQYQLPGASELTPTYWVRLSEQDGHEVASVLVNAMDGTVALTASEHQTAKNRNVCDLASVRVNLDVEGNYRCNNVTPLGTGANARHEGGPASSVADVNQTFNHLGVAYDYMKTNFDRDSFNGRGAEINATVRACHSGTSAWDCPFQNAFWDGRQFVFGAGWATDDVVAHEYVHAVTDNASNLFYWTESGALNEAFSDIFAQFIDLQTPLDDAGTKRWLIGEDLPTRPNGSAGAIRNMMVPNEFAQPATVLTDSYWVTDLRVDNGGVHTNSGVANRAAALLYDGDGSLGISSLGPQKSAQLWYRVLHLLPSGSNYTQFGLALQATCRELIGNYGFSSGDCTSVNNALYATNILHPQGVYTDCAGQHVTTLFSDDFENGGSKWTASDSGFWDFIPSSSYPFTYASSGKGSANGWTIGTEGNNTYLETKNSFLVPEGNHTWLSFKTATLYAPSVPGDAGLKLFVNAGQGLETVVYRDIVASQFSPYPNNVGAGGYGLAQWSGKQIKLRFVIHNPNGRIFDFYIDDVVASFCDMNKPGAIQDAYAYTESSSLTVDWKAPYVPGSAGIGDYHYELSYSPAIPGAPATFQPSAVTPRYQVMIPGIDPSKKYTVTVKVKMNAGSTAEGPPVTVTADPQAPLTCAYKPRGSLSPAQPGRIMLPHNVCTYRSVPRL